MPNRKSKNPQGHRKQKTIKADAGKAAVAEVIQLPGTEAVDVPKPPEGLLDVTVEIWKDFFASEVSEVVGPADRYALRRWIEAVDQRERYAELVRDEPTVEGSQGQPVLNPLAKRLDAIENEIRKFEAQFGMTPKARADLGVQTGAAAMTAQRLNEMVRGGHPNGAGREGKKEDGQTGVIDGEGVEEVEV